MKLVGSWWLPDQDNHHKVLLAAENDSWPCYDVLELAMPYVQQFGKAIDVGAWIGDSTAWLAKKFDHVVAFEPNNSVCECTVSNLKDRRIANYQLHQCGLSDNNTTMEFYNQVGTMSGWVSSKIYDIELEPYIIPNNKVQCNTLDSFKFQSIDFLKIDVDSHEGYLLLGAKEFFTLNRPVVLLEHKLRAQKRQVDESPNPLEIMHQYGYKIVEHDKIDYVLVPQ